VNKFEVKKYLNFKIIKESFAKLCFKMKSLFSLVFIVFVQMALDEVSTTTDGLEDHLRRPTDGEEPNQESCGKFWKDSNPRMGESWQAMCEWDTIIWDKKMLVTFSTHHYFFHFSLNYFVYSIRHFWPLTISHCMQFVSIIN